MIRQSLVITSSGSSSRHDVTYQKIANFQNTKKLSLCVTSTIFWTQVVEVSFATRVARVVRRNKCVKKRRSN